MFKLIQYFNRALEINPADSTALKTKGMILSHIASLPLVQNNTTVANKTSNTQQKNNTSTNNTTFNPDYCQSSNVSATHSTATGTQNGTMSGFLAREYDKLSSFCAQDYLDCDRKLEYISKRRYHKIL